MTKPVARTTLAAILLASTAFLAPISAAAFDAGIDAMLQSWKNENEVIGNADGPAILSTETPDATQRFNERLQGIATARTSTRGTTPRPTTTAGRTPGNSPQGERRTITVGELTVDRELAPKLDMDAAAEGIVALREPSAGSASISSTTSRPTASSTARPNTTTRTARPPITPAPSAQDAEESDVEEAPPSDLALYDEDGVPMGSISAEEREVVGVVTPSTTRTSSPRTASPSPTQTASPSRSAGTTAQPRTATQASTTRTSGATQKVKLYDEEGRPIGELSLTIPESKSGAPPSTGTRRSVASRAPSEEESEDLAY